MNMCNKYVGLDKKKRVGNEIFMQRKRKRVKPQNERSLQTVLGKYFLELV